MSILTVTLNPAIDISYPLEAFHLNTVNRVAQVGKTAGGKGLNVSHVLKELGADVLATGFADDILGAEIVENLKSEGIDSRFTKIWKDTQLYCDFTRRTTDRDFRKRTTDFKGRSRRVY